MDSGDRAAKTVTTPTKMGNVSRCAQIIAGMDPYSTA